MVRDVVPDCFAAYVRLLHPFRLDGQHVRWEELAADNGRVVTGRARVEDILTTSLEEARQTGLTIGGSLPPRDWESLGVIAERHSSSELAVFGLWEGRGRPASLPDGRSISLLTLPNRRYYLAEVPFRYWADSKVVDDIVNLAWPSDRSWFLNNDIDFCATYIGGSRAFITELIGSPTLEAFPAALSDPVWNY